MGHESEPENADCLSFAIVPTAFFEHQETVRLGQRGKS
jgi:hypothetical protein